MNDVVLNELLKELRLLQEMSDMENFATYNVTWIF